MFIIEMMNNQKLNFQFPERVDLSSLLLSKPLSPLQPPPQFRNQAPIYNNQFHAPPPQFMINSPQRNGQNLNYPPSNGYIVQNNAYPMPQLIPTSIPPSSYPSAPFHSPANRQLPINSPVKFQFSGNQGRSSPPPSQLEAKDSGERPSSPDYTPIIKLRPRPKSPKIEFKYASPPKQSRQLSEIKQLSNQSGIRPHSLAAQQSLSLKPLKPKESPKKQQIEIKTQLNSPSPQKNNTSQSLKQAQDSQVNSSIKSPVSGAGQNRSSITNYIYMVDNKEIKEEEKVNDKGEEREKPVEPVPEKKERKETEIKQKLIQKAQRFKDQDDEIKLMLKEYENLKRYSYNESSGQLPRVQRNSSQQNQQDQPTPRPQSRSKKQPWTFGTIPEPSQPQPNTLRYQTTNPIREQSHFAIEGIENVKSEVFDGLNGNNQRSWGRVRLLKLNSQEKETEDRDGDGDRDGEREGEDVGDLSYKLKQKDIEIKNLKNQVWLMKLRENELLAKINKLEQLNKGQEMEIISLRSRQ